MAMWLVIGGVLVTASMLYVAEVALRTKKILQLPGLAERYLGNTGSVLIFIGVCCNSLGCMVAYTTGSGAIIASFLGCSETAGGLIFSEEILRQCKKGLIFINVTRGEIAPEAGLLHLYQEGLIGGIGLDVFTAENDFSQSLRNHKAYSDENLLAAKRLLEMAENRTANIYVQPHQAFNSDLAAAAKASDTIN